MWRTRRLGSESGRAHIARVEKLPSNGPEQIDRESSGCTAPVSLGTSNVVKSPPRARTKRWASPLESRRYPVIVPSGLRLAPPLNH
jgi:hypothetical protein